MNRDTQYNCSVAILSVIHPVSLMLSVSVLNVDMLSVVMLCDIMLSVVMLCDIMLSVIMLSVLAHCQSIRLYKQIGAFL
jgi:hypothetical protein